MNNDGLHPHMVLYNRRTGQIIGRPTRIPDNEYPFRVPPNTTTLIRYVDFWKLKDLIKSGELHLCRSDKLEDQLEGKYAEANKTYLTNAYQNFLQQFNGTHDGTGLVNQSDIMRSEVFILCWQMENVEDQQMWQTFTTTNEAVAICSTFGQLTKSLPKNKNLGYAKVRYLNQSTPRAEWHSLAPFYAKDPQFANEKELRCTFTRSLEEVSSSASHEFMRVRTCVDELINEIILHPSAPPEMKEEIKALCRKAHITATIRDSTLTV